MPITSIYIDSELPVIPGMKTLDDFIIRDWFPGFPAVDGTKIGGYYFGSEVTNISMNSFNESLPASIIGTLDNSSGSVNVDVNNYINTNITSPQKIKVFAVIKRPAVPSSNIYFISDFSGINATGTGFALGIGTDGRLRMVAQNSGEPSPGAASVVFPSSIPVGGLCAIAAHVIQGTAYVAVYDPSTLTYSGASAAVSGTRVAGSTGILLGRKVDNNTSTSSTALRSAVLIDGEVTGAQQLAVMQYLLSM
ncbi:TPA: hypothetical protein ACRR13_003991 [Klebsiella quasipneumoniae]|uniref:hypothetical protein n=1 Tax=Klebsiella variicola TaxID=244366 RepID=UPI00115747D0|nr:hypothetical protein [Klebsiella variicola]